MQSGYTALTSGGSGVDTLLQQEGKGMWIHCTETRDESVNHTGDGTNKQTFFSRIA